VNEDYALASAADREDVARERAQAEDERREQIEKLSAERVEAVEDMAAEDWFALLNLAVSCRSAKLLQARLNDLAVLSQKIEGLEALGE